MEPVLWKFVEPLESPSQLEVFERRYHYRIPAALKTLIREFNGGCPDRKVFDQPQTGMVFSHLLSFNPDSPESVFHCLREFESGDTLRALPFATDGFGNLICEHAGQIWFWEHETARMELVADSLPELLERLHS